MSSAGQMLIPQSSRSQLLCVVDVALCIVDKSDDVTLCRPDGVERREGFVLRCWPAVIDSLNIWITQYQTSQQQFLHASRFVIVFSCHHHECVVLLVANSLQSG